MTQRLANLETAITRAGGIVRFARSLGITHQAIYAWRKRGSVPLDKAIMIEEQFGVPRTDLIDPKLLSLINTPAADNELL